MSLEELNNLDTPPVNTVNSVDDFEAALAASSDSPVIDVAVVPDQVESEIDSMSRTLDGSLQGEHDKLPLRLNP